MFNQQKRKHSCTARRGLRCAQACFARKSFSHTHTRQPTAPHGHLDANDDSEDDQGGGRGPPRPGAPAPARPRDPAALALRKWVQGPSTDEYLDCYLARFAKVCPRVDEVLDMAWNGTTVPFAAYDFFKKTILPQAFDVAAQDVDRVAESLAGTEAEQEA